MVSSQYVNQLISYNLCLSLSQKLFTFGYQGTTGCNFFFFPSFIET